MVAHWPSLTHGLFCLYGLIGFVFIQKLLSLHHVVGALPVSFEICGLFVKSCFTLSYLFIFSGLSLFVLNISLWLHSKTESIVLAVHLLLSWVLFAQVLQNFLLNFHLLIDHV